MLDHPGDFMFSLADLAKSLDSKPQSTSGDHDLGSLEEVQSQLGGADQGHVRRAQQKVKSLPLRAGEGDAGFKLCHGQPAGS
jgi:hypothetical protein